MAKAIAVTGFKSEAAKSGARKLRGELVRAMADLKRFRKLLKPLFATPDDAFDDLSEGHESIQRSGFIRRAQELGFTGDAGRLFDLFSDAEGHVSNIAFRQRMAAAGRTKRLVKDGDGFAEAVDLAVRAVGLPPDDAAKAALAAEQVLKRAGSRRGRDAEAVQKPRRSRSKNSKADKEQRPPRSRSRGSMGRSSSSLARSSSSLAHKEKDKERSIADDAKTRT